MDTYAEEWLDEEYRNFADEWTNESTSSFIDSSEVAESINNQVSPVISSCIPSTIPERTDRTLNRIPERSKTPLSTNIPRPSPSINPANSIASSSGINNRTRLSPSISPANSIASSSGINNCTRPSPSISPSPTIQTTKKRKLDSETVYVGAIEALAHSIKQPITVQRTDTSINNSANNVLDPVDTCMAFIGSLLKHFKNERLQFQVMNRLVEMVIIASTEDLQGEKR